MYSVRAAKIDDVLEIHKLAQELLEKSVYHYIDMDDVKFRRLTAAAICGHYAAVFVVVGDDNTPVGFLIGTIEELFFSKKKYATDLCAYVKPEAAAYGAFMVRRFIKWAKSIPNVVEITLGISSGIGDVDRVGKLYERLGLSRVGGLYTMRVDK